MFFNIYMSHKFILIRLSLTILNKGLLFLFRVKIILEEQAMVPVGTESFGIMHRILFAKYQK